MGNAAVALAFAWEGVAATVDEQPTHSIATDDRYVRGPVRGCRRVPSAAAMVPITGFAARR
jgi:hypothetical protein